MALNYLLSPEFQVVNTAGKPATGGYLEVYISGSRERYYCASDFNGTLYPFQVPLDSLGSNVVLADDSHAYDVYIYNRYGGELMSRYNVHPGAGGGIGINDITSSDGSIIVTQTANGVDLRTNSTPPSILRATAETLYMDGQFTFAEAQRDGQNAIVDAQGKVIVNEGWWHYDATVKLRWTGPEQNETQSVSLYTHNASDSLTFDLSYPHNETVQVSGEYKALNDSTQFVLGVTGVPSGMSVELVDFGVHSIIGEGAGGKYEAGEGITIDEPNRVISVDFDTVQGKLTAGTGITIDENNVISATEAEIYTVDYNGSPIVEGTELFDEAYAAYQAGKTLVLNWVNSNRKGSCIGYYSAYGLMFSVEIVNLVGTQSDAATEGFTEYLWLYSYGTQSRWRSSTLNLLPRSYAADAGKVLMVDPEHPTSTPIWQAIPAQQQADWAQSDTTAVDYIQNKPNLARVALTGEYSDLAHTPHIPSTTSQLVNDSGFIAGDEVPRYQAHADWQASSSEAGYIYNKPFIPTETSDLHNDSGYITASDVPINQVQSDWTESDSLTPAYIQHKPEMKELVAGSNITIVEASGSNTVTISASMPNVPVQDVQIDNVSVVNAQGIAEIPRQQNADWNSSAGASEILNKPDLSVYATNTALTNGLATKQDTISDLATIRSGAALGATSVQPGDLATVATTGSYSDLSGTPSIPVIGTVTL